MPSTLINSQWIEGEGPMLRSTTPDERRTLWKTSESSIEQVTKAVSQAHKSQESWGKMPLSERIEIAREFAGLLKKNQGSLAQSLSLETGKPLWEAETEITACFNKIEISNRAQQERAGYHQNQRHSLCHQAHGVMSVFGPFNFPMHLPNGHIVPALLAGNSVVFKPSELTPLCAEQYCKLWLEAGLPAGVLNLVQGGAEVGKALIKTDIDGVLFTGSYDTGTTIHRQFAGRPEILLALEMGGNNPLIVGDTAHLDLAANTILHSAFLSAGQRCTCTNRLILVRSENTEALVEKLLTQSHRIILSNDPDGLEPFMGPVICRKNAGELLNTQSTLIKQGAKALKYMSSTDESGVYLTAGILDMTDCESRYDKEYFGPLLQLSYADRFSDAIEDANNTRFGLAAGLISDNTAEINQFRERIRAGIVSINLPTAGASSELPFGGIGCSGNHRPSAYYAADYSAWPQAISSVDSEEQVSPFSINAIRGLR